MRCRLLMGGVLLVMMLFGTIGCGKPDDRELSRLPDRKRGQFLHQLRRRKAGAVQPLRLAAGGGAQLCVLPRVR